MNLSTTHTALLIHNSLSLLFQTPSRLKPSGWIGHLPFAFWLIDASRPKTLVELGAHHGVSFCAFCQQAAKLNLNCQFYAIDSWQGDDQAGFYGNEVYEDLAAFVHKNYPSFAHLVRCQFDEAAPLFDDRSIDLLHIDGLHTKEAILHDFETWLPKVSDKGVVIFHDINARQPGFGGFAAWNDISVNYPHFAFDHAFGLGVLLTGINAPSDLKDLCDLEREQKEELKSFFANVGTMYQALHDIYFDYEQKLNKAWLERCDLQAQHNTHAKNLQATFEKEKKHLQVTFEEEKKHLHNHYQNILTEHQQAYESTQQRCLNLENALDGMRNSKSWKITAPLRLGARLFRKRSQ